MTEIIELDWIAGFWRRIGAFIFDSIILALTGIGLGVFLSDVFVEIGGWGRFVGFTIALFYFGLMNSERSNGQTLGKRAFKIKVVDKDNKPISVIKSFGRYSILGIPFFLNGASLPDVTMFSYWIYVLSFIVFGGLLSIIYLYIFNRVTRQSLHDIVCRTYVVNDEVAPRKMGHIWKPHLLVISILFVAAAIVPVYTTSLAKQKPFSELLSSLEIIKNHPVVKYATLSYGSNVTSTVKTGRVESRYITAQVFISKDDTANVKLAKKLAAVLVKNISGVRDKDLIIIDLIYGYDIGIASRWESNRHSFAPSDIFETF